MQIRIVTTMPLNFALLKNSIMSPPFLLGLNRFDRKLHHHVALPDRVDHVHPLDDFPEHRVLAVQVRLGRVGDEELAPVGAGPALAMEMKPVPCFRGLPLHSSSNW